MAATLDEFQLPKAALQPFPAATKRLINGLRRRSEATLQNGQREADCTGALVVLECLSAVKLYADVICYRAVQLGFRIGEFIRHRVSETLGEKSFGLKGQEFLFDHAAHQIGDVGNVRAITEAAFETVSVEQRHE